MISGNMEPAHTGSAKPETTEDNLPLGVALANAIADTLDTPTHAIRDDKLALACIKLLCTASASNALKDKILAGEGSAIIIKLHSLSWGVITSLSQESSDLNNTFVARYDDLITACLVTLRNLSDRDLSERWADMSLLALGYVREESQTEAVKCAAGILCNITSNNGDAKAFLIEKQIGQKVQRILVR